MPLAAIGPHQDRDHPRTSVALPHLARLGRQSTRCPLVRDEGSTLSCPCAAPDPGGRPTPTSPNGPGYAMRVHDLQPAVHERLTPQQTFGLELCHRHAGALALLASLILDDDDAADEVVSETIAEVCLFADQPAARD